VQVVVRAIARELIKGILNRRARYRGRKIASTRLRGTMLAIQWGNKVMSVRLSIHLDDEVHRTLDVLATATKQSRSALAADAIRTYIDARDWQIREVVVALQEADAGDFATDAELNAFARRHGLARPPHGPSAGVTSAPLDDQPVVIRPLERGEVEYFTPRSAPRSYGGV